MLIIPEWVYNKNKSQLICIQTNILQYSFSNTNTLRMDDQINILEPFDPAMHYGGNNFSNFLEAADPDLQMGLNIPDSQLITGDEFHQHTNSLLNNFTCVSLNIASLIENFFSLQIYITHQFAPTVLELSETKLTNELQESYSLPGFNL